MGRAPSYPVLRERARKLRRVGRSSGEISTALLREHPDLMAAARYPNGVPTSTLKSWLRDVRQDDSGPWRIWEVAAATAPDPALIVRWLGAIRWTSGGRWWLTFATVVR